MSSAVRSTQRTARHEKTTVKISACCSLPKSKRNSSHMLMKCLPLTLTAIHHCFRCTCTLMGALLVTCHIAVYQSSSTCVLTATGTAVLRPLLGGSMMKHSKSSYPGIQRKILRSPLPCRPRAAQIQVLPSAPSYRHDVYRRSLWCHEII